MPKPQVVVQIGHEEPRDQSHPSSGAAGELALVRRIGAALVERLERDGRVDVKRIPGRFPAEISGGSWRVDAFIALHGDSVTDAAVEGYTFGFPPTSTVSKKFADLVAAQFSRFHRSHRRQDNVTGALKHYYGWDPRRMPTQAPRILVEYPAAYLQPVGSNGQGGIGLAVGASTISGTRASFSNTGSYVSLAAPGENVFAALSKDSSAKDYPRVKLPGSTAGFYGYISGTSFSAPQVAGAAALVWGANQQLNARQVADILKATASGHGAWNAELGYGVIDVAAAVEAARSTPAASLNVYRAYGSATLSWSGTAPAQSYRLLEHVGTNPDRVLLDVTTKRSFEYQVKDNDTHVLTVEALDAAGNVVARSAALPVTLGQAKSSLALKGYRFR